MKAEKVSSQSEAKPHAGWMHTKDHNIRRNKFGLVCWRFEVSTQGGVTLIVPEGPEINNITVLTNLLVFVGIRILQCLHGNKCCMSILVHFIAREMSTP